MSVADAPDVLNPQVVGARLQQARKARGLTQGVVASEVGIVRTTLVAIEKGQRRVTPNELIALARIYGRNVSDFVGGPAQTEPFVAQFRTTIRPEKEQDTADEPWSGLEEATATLQRYAEQYIELEKLVGPELARKHPSQYDIKGLSPDVAGEEVASAERQRLGLGDGPVANLRDRLEADVGIRTFYFPMLSSVAGLFAFNEAAGACVGINSLHPSGRQRWTLAHEYSHFLTSRYAMEVTWLADRKRTSPRERTADRFAQHFLMAPAGLSRRFSDLQRARGGATTLADLCTLADLYEVSVQALVRALEAMERLPQGLWERLEVKGFRPQQAQAILGLQAYTRVEPRFTRRYETLAIQAFNGGELSEGQLAAYLDVDRVTARSRVHDLAQRIVAERGDEIGTLSIDLGHRVQER